MPAIPPDVTIQRLIDSAHESKQEQPRPHYGCSVAGRKCLRQLWLAHRWAVVEQFPGRILRLFRRGHHEEDWIAADLEAIGCTVTDRQSRVVFGAHASGSVDGVITGVPEAPKAKHLLECKTSGLAPFKRLVKAGVKREKPEHYAQMQLYMLGSQSPDTWVGSEPPKLNRAFYYVVCKDNDEIYTERLEFDREYAEKQRDRAMANAASDRMPRGISTDPSWRECGYCAAHSFCHKTHLATRINCRTCAHSTANSEGWRCERWDAEIPAEGQRVGCDNHVMHPDLMPMPMESVGERWVVAYGDLLNGNPSEYPGALSSKEIIERLKDE